MNQNPRPPNERRSKNADKNQTKRIKDKLAKKLLKMETKRSGQMAKDVPTFTPTQKPLNANTLKADLDKVGSNPLDALNFSSFQPGQGQEDPRDAEYWKNTTRLLAQTQGAYAEGLLQKQRMATDKQKYISDAGIANAQNVRGIGENSMRQGLAFSGFANRQQSENQSDYLRAVEDYNTDYSRGEQDLTRQMGGFLSDFIAGEGDLAGEAVGRAQERYLSSAANDAPAYSTRDAKRINKLVRKLGKAQKKRKQPHRGVRV